MSVPARFLDELRARVPVSQVVGRRVRLQRKGREQLGLCPFHGEKTPSFTVNDDKGFYHCFGCGAHGTAIDFVMNTENMPFREAVERLAAEAGLEVPRDSPESQARDRQRKTLHEILAMARQWYEKQLRMPEGRAALDYLKGRGLTDDTISRFGLGFAPDSRDGLKAWLAGQGGEERDMVAAGLRIRPEDSGRRPYDRFRGRVMFPIQDQRGRVIGFGGRILGDGEPKYLNSPETELFHKGETLYGLDLALPEARKQQRLFVVEGYMDVIALAQAGVANAVAPLGTALTEEQITLLWRIVPDPVLCFDGDAAGQRAASRAAERALPRLRPGIGLRFMQLPAGEDPDSLVAGQGLSAFMTTAEGAIQLSELVWRMESDGRPMATAEDRAGLEQRLKSRAFSIENADVRSHYLADFKDRLWRAFRARRSGSGAVAKSAPIHREHGNARRLSESLLLAVVLLRPEIHDDVDEALGKMSFVDSGMDELRQKTIACLSADPDMSSADLHRQLDEEGHGAAVDQLVNVVIRDHGRFALPEKDKNFVLKGWKEAFDRYICDELDLEIEHLKQRLEQDMSPENVRELNDLIVYRREFGPFAGLARQDRRVGSSSDDGGA